MNKKASKIKSLCFLVLSALLLVPCFAEEDELSPETLPDEIPIQQNFGNPTNQLELGREVQAMENNSATTTLKPKDDDAELEKPLTPLFPTEPQELGSHDLELSNKNQIDEDLSQPDPSYIPQPQPAPPTVSLKTPEPKAALKEILKSEQPPLKAENNPVPPIETQNKRPEPSKPIINPRPAMVWAPEILKQMLADPLNPVPIETYMARLAVPPTTPSRPPKGTSDFSVILSNNEFYPSKIILKSGSAIRLLFTTTNKKSAALVIEKLNIQRWVSSQSENEKVKELDRTKFEVNKELTANRVTEVEFQAKPGVYSFHDVITGASGEISVEEP